MSSYHAAYLTYQQQVYQAMMLLAAAAVIQIAGWVLGPRVIKRWSRYEDLYLALCAVLYFTIIVLPFWSA